MTQSLTRLALAIAVIAPLSACGGDDDSLPRLGAASPATLASCTALPPASASPTPPSPPPSGCRRRADQCWAAGRRALPGDRADEPASSARSMARPTPSASRCACPRAGAAATSTRAMAAPTAWWPRPTAASAAGGPLLNGLQLGFAVISSDAGHSAAQNPLFGVDPQARLDYGYQAVGTLTPMAKALIQAAYGKEPRSLLHRRHLQRRAPRHGGCSALCRRLRRLPGRCHPASTCPRPRWPSCTAPSSGTRWPPRRAQRPTSTWSRPCPRPSGGWSARPSWPGAMRWTAWPTAWCRTWRPAARPSTSARDVPTCTGARDGTCLTAAQKTVVANVSSRRATSPGARPSTAGWPFDAGIVQTGLGRLEVPQLGARRHATRWRVAHISRRSPPGEPPRLAQHRWPMRWASTSTPTRRRSLPPTASTPKAPCRS